MNTVHRILIDILALILGGIAGYACRGLINRLLKKASAPLLTKVTDVRTHLQAIYDSAETDINKIKAEVLKVITKIEKVLP
jgi:hypothetical protein